MRTKNAKNKKKIKSKSCTLGEISFKSRLELNCYKRLIAADIQAEYETEKFELLPKLTLEDITVYERGKLNKQQEYSLIKKKSFIRHITYTPDFVIHSGKTSIYIDTKGFATDRYIVKKKLFLAKLNEENKEKNKIYFFEPHNIKEIDQMIQLIKKIQDEQSM